MESVKVEYHLDRNQRRIRKQSDSFIDRTGWLIIGECESDEAEAFIKAIIAFVVSIPVLVQSKSRIHFHYSNSYQC